MRYITLRVFITTPLHLTLPTVAVAATSVPGPRGDVPGVVALLAEYTFAASSSRTLFCDGRCRRRIYDCVTESLLSATVTMSLSYYLSLPQNLLRQIINDVTSF